MSLYFTPSSGNGTTVYFTLGQVKQIYKDLDMKSARCFSQVNRTLQEIYLSDDLQRDLIVCHFQWPLIPSLSFQEQYRRLFLSRMPHASPILERALELKEGGYLHETGQEDGIFKINSLGTVVAIESEESSFICHLNTGKVIKTDNIGQQHPISRLKIDREGKGIYKYSREEKGILSYYDSTTGECERRLNLIDADFPYVFAVRVNPEARTIFSVHSSREPEKTRGPLDPKTCRYLAEISRLWDLDTGAIIHTFDHRKEPLRWFKMLPDGTQFLSGSIKPSEMADEEPKASDNWYIRLWNFNTKTSIPIDTAIKVHPNDYNIDMSLSGDGRKALFDRGEAPSQYCSLLDGGIIAEIDGWDALGDALRGKCGEYVGKPFLNHEGTRAFDNILEEENNEWFAIWDPTTGTPLAQISLQNDTVDLAIEPDERKLVCLTSFDSSEESKSRIGIQIFDLSASFPSSFPSVFLPESRPPTSSLGFLKINPLSLRYVTLHNDLKVWNSAPLVHERIADVAAYWLCGSAHRETVFDRLPASVKEFVDRFPEENTTDVISKRYQGLMRYLEEKCVPEIVDLLDKAVIASENQQEEEAAIYREQALRWIENTALEEEFKMLVQNICTSRVENLIAEGTNFRQIALAYKTWKLVVPPGSNGAQKRKLPEILSEQEANKRRHFDGDAGSVG